LSHGGQSATAPAKTKAKVERPAFDAASRERNRQANQIVFDDIRHRDFASKDDLLADLSRAYEQRGIEPEPGEVNAIAESVDAWNSRKYAGRISVFRRLISEAAKGIGRKRETT
jgi:hypothetical protein